MFLAAVNFHGSGKFSSFACFPFFFSKKKMKTNQEKMLPWYEVVNSRLMVR